MISVILLIVATVMMSGPAPSSDHSQGASQEATHNTPHVEDSILYGRHGSMRTRSGQRDAVIDILIAVSEVLLSEGCHLYLVSRAPDDPDLILVTEVWESRQAHKESLRLAAVREAIGLAMPHLTGEFTVSEFDVVGGLGLPGS